MIGMWDNKGRGYRDMIIWDGVGGFDKDECEKRIGMGENIGNWDMDIGK